MREERTRPSREPSHRDATYESELFLQPGTSCEFTRTDSLLPGDDLVATLRASELRLSAFLEDRSRLARDLHDIVLQSLYAIGLGIETARRTCHERQVERRCVEGPMVDQLNKLIHQVRGMIQGLESGMVEEFDLEAELAALADIYMRISPIRIAVRMQPGVSRHLTREEKQEIINIAREAVSNCVRHAKASAATLSLALRGTTMCLLIRDNGVGFASNSPGPSGYGLSNMTARTRRLGGRLEIRSRPGSGTLVGMEFPMEPVSATS